MTYARQSARIVPHSRINDQADKVVCAAAWSGKGTLPWAGVPDSVASALLVVQRLDRIEAGGAGGGIEAEHQPDRHGHEEREDDRGGRDNGGPSRTDATRELIQACGQSDSMMPPTRGIRRSTAASHRAPHPTEVAR